MIEEHDSTYDNYTSLRAIGLTHRFTSVAWKEPGWRNFTSRGGFTGLATAQWFRLNDWAPNIQLFTHAIFSHPLLPDSHTPVWVLCPDSSAHHKYGALLPIITLHTCTSVSLHCLWRLDQNLLSRSWPLRWMKSLHLQVKWTKTRSLRDCG